MNNCGSCKFLDVPEESLKKDGTVQKHYASRLFNCVVPFTMHPVPSCFYVQFDFKRKMMCPIYGLGCPFHEKRGKK